MKKFTPYFQVIFTSKRSKHLTGYEKMNARMAQLVEEQRGYLGSESFSNEEGRHVTIVKFETEDDIVNWKNNEFHLEAQKKGIELWYDYYSVHICKVEREYEFKR